VRVDVPIPARLRLGSTFGNEAYLARKAARVCGLILKVEVTGVIPAGVTLRRVFPREWKLIASQGNCCDGQETFRRARTQSCPRPESIQFKL
jgi:hypothetical protein